ncbi:hypothetical protein D0962_00060 [Leptolyngbyaceae cyanobacterium CCMR0082]|uniref:Uncharacterized protein n=1 Tax=Adonisia turfae CCMR0082 TaxID=2304604 RepID=A0A6M0RY93_9CYAN|nr:hypothetical protein [Adonisia turfae CCMR0082]
MKDSGRRKGPKTKPVPIRFTLQQLALMQGVASIEGIPFATWARKVLMDEAAQVLMNESAQANKTEQGQEAA